MKKLILILGILLAFAINEIKSQEIILMSDIRSDTLWDGTVITTTRVFDVYEHNDIVPTEELSMRIRITKYAAHPDTIYVRETFLPMKTLLPDETLEIHTDDYNGVFTYAQILNSIYVIGREQAFFNMGMGWLQTDTDFTFY